MSYFWIFSGFARPTVPKEIDTDDDDDVVILSEHLDDSQKPLFEKMIQKIKQERDFDTSVLLEDEDSELEEDKAPNLDEPEIEAELVRY